MSYPNGQNKIPKSTCGKMDGKKLLKKGQGKPLTQNRAGSPPTRNRAGNKQIFYNGFIFLKMGV
jgi:hypothetical protein